MSWVGWSKTFRRTPKGHEMSATIAPNGRITRTPSNPTTGTPGQGWKRVAGWVAYGVAWLVTVWLVAPVSYAWSFKIVRIVFFPVRVAWWIARILSAPVWVPIRAGWRRSVANRGSLARKVHKSARKGRRSAVRTAGELYGASNR